MRGSTSCCGGRGARVGAAVPPAAAALPPRRSEPEILTGSCPRPAAPTDRAPSESESRESLRRDSSPPRLAPTVAGCPSHALHTVTEGKPGPQSYTDCQDANARPRIRGGPGSGLCDCQCHQRRGGIMFQLAVPAQGSPWVVCP